MDCGGQLQCGPWSAANPSAANSACRLIAASARDRLLGEGYSMTRASYDLTRLRRNGLITRVPGRNLYQLTADGQAFAIFYTKVHNRVLRPLLATDAPQAPQPLRATLRTIDQQISAYLDQARLPMAAG
jgi:hypothetical protein